MTRWAGSLLFALSVVALLLSFEGAKATTTPTLFGVVAALLIATFLATPSPKVGDRIELASLWDGFLDEALPLLDAQAHGHPITPTDYCRLCTYPERWRDAVLSGALPWPEGVPSGEGRRDA